MKRVVFVLTQSLESPGGGGRYLPLAKALRQHGFDVSIVALHHNMLQLHQHRFVQDGVQIRYVGQMHVRKVDNQKYYFNPLQLLWITFWATIRLFWGTWREQPDIIHIGKSQPMNGVAAWLNHLLFRTPVFLDSDDYEAGNNRFSGGWQRRIVAAFEDWLPSFAKGISAGNSFIAERFLENGYPERLIEVVHNGVDRERFVGLETAVFQEKVEAHRTQLTLPPANQLIVYIGSMSLTSHAVDLLLMAFVTLHKQMPQTKLLLVGAGEDLQYLQELADQLGLGELCVFTGRVPSNEVALYFRLGAFTVDPRRRSISAESSLSLKLVESIAAGVPCLTADVGDLKGVVGEAGTAVPPGDASALANQMAVWLQNPDQLEAMRQEARRMAPTVWWEARVHQILRLYERGLGQPIDTDHQNSQSYAK